MEVLHSAEFDSPIGRIRVFSSARGLAYLELPLASGRGLRGWLSRHSPGATVLEGYAPNRAAVSQLIDFLDGKRRTFDLVLDLRATLFQKAVLEQVSAIGYGETSTYSAIAKAMGRPTATRAVGAANGANPLSLIIPCHRVIGANGKLQGYGGGIDTKARLLAMERQGPAEGWLL
jgi:O-6-methylguanine DNA methyltransferase